MTTKSKYGTKELESELGVITFGKMLESHRKSDEYSQKEFAALLGISASSLCDLEKSRKIPSPRRASNIAETLGLSVNLCIKIALQDQLRDQGIDLEVSVS